MNDLLGAEVAQSVPKTAWATGIITAFADSIASVLSE